MSESYTIGGNAFYPLLEPNLNCQTFRPLETHRLDWVDVNLKTPAFSAPVFCAIYWGLLPYMWPTTPLAVSRIDPGPTLPGSVNRYRFPIKAHPILQAGQYYSILIYQGKILFGDRVEILYDNAFATYPRGFRIHSEDSGQNWSWEYNQDTIFTEFGGPPLQQQDLPPPVSLWAAYGIEFYHCLSTEIITLTTSVPCHLSCHWTFIEPKKHYLSRLIRGIKVPWTTRFSFAPFFTVEQSERGDTIYHTFTILDRHFDSPYWFSFRGEIDFKLSPSVGPIFERTPTYNTPFRHGSFDEWFDPEAKIYAWKKVFSGIGTHTWIREETLVHEAPWAAKMISSMYMTFTQLKQTFCAADLAGKKVTFSFWLRTEGAGQPRISVWAPSPAHFSWSWGGGSGGWRKVTYTRTLWPKQGPINILIGTMSFSDALSTSIFDEITVKEV